MRALAPFRAAVAVAAAIAAGACDKPSPSPTPGPPAAPSVPGVPGTTQVTGRERIGWEHRPAPGAQISYWAYVDGVSVLLDSSCALEGADARCSAPLPAMTDGLHALDISALESNTGLESERSAPLSLQKVTALAARTASALPDAHAATGAASGLVRTAAGTTADVLTRGVRMPAQLALLPDGRLLVAEAGGGVRIVQTDASREPLVALEPGALLDPAPTGPLAIATAADFAVTRHVFLADLYAGDRDRLRARIVRLREVGDRLGEPATIFDAPVAADAASAEGVAPLVGRGSHGLRLAFGGDRLLYAALPPGLVFDGQPAASRPVPAVVRLTADGQTPDAGALAGITSHPLAFAWHPTSGDLLGLVIDRTTGARVRTLGAASNASEPTMAGVGRLRAEIDGVAQLLRVDATAARVAVGAVAASGLTDPAQWPRTVRLALPTELADVVPGLTGRLTDVVTQDGVVYGLVSDAPAGPGLDAPDGMIVRLRP